MNTSSLSLSLSFASRSPASHPHDLHILQGVAFSRMWERCQQGPATFRPAVGLHSPGVRVCVLHGVPPLAPLLSPLEADSDQPRTHGPGE